MIGALALAWWPAVGLAQSGDASADVGMAKVEAEAFEAARGRFAQRMSELAEDTRRFVDLREAEERAKVSSGYDSLIGALDETARERRDQSIERFETFLERYPDVPYSSDVRFRLADLLWERAREEWLDEHAEYDIVEAELLEEGRFDELPPEPMVQLGRTIELYQRIIEDNVDLPREQQYEFLDGAYYMLGFAYKDENAAQRDPDLARQSMEQLIVHRPDSDLVDTAHLYVGNLLFDSGRFDAAIDRYRTVMDKGPEGRHYMDAMYYLAWSHYKMSTLPEEYPAALDLFDRLLDASQEQYEQSGRRSDYEPDAIKYMAHSFADVSDLTGASATAVAEAYLGLRSTRPYDRDIYEALGEVLVQYGRYEQAVDVYRRLQEDPWQLEPDNPNHQFEVVRLLATVASRAGEDASEASGQARVDLTARYNESTEWWEANRNNPEALQQAREYIEGSLSTVAREYWFTADRTGAEEDYRRAAAEFQRYLDTFPIAEDYYEHQWYLAAALFNAGEYERADREYQALLKTSRQHGYGDGAVYQSLLARQRLLEARFGPPEQLPPSATVQRTWETPFGETVEEYALSEDHQRFIESVDSVLAHEFEPSDAEGALPYEDLVAAVERNRPTFAYIAAQILKVHHHYEDALPRLEAIIKAHPDRNEASWSAGYVTDIFMALGDMDSLRNRARQYRLMSLGETEDKAADFADLEQGAAFKQAKQLITEGELEAGAEAYLAFHEQYPDSDYAPDALINAANNFQRSGRAERAIELFEQFVDLYPSHPFAEELYFRIAANYESIFELDKAVYYYDELVRRFPDSELNASSAQYNAAFLRTGLGEHAEAGAAYEAYGERFPDRADAEDVYFKAGRQYELAGDAQAEAFYRRYLDRYGDEAHVDHALEARFKLGELAKKRGDEQSWDEYLDRVAEDYRAYVSEGVEVGWKGSHYAAQAAFRDLQASYDEMVADELTGNETGDAALLEAKPEELQAFEAEANRFISTYGDFDYSMAALFLVAEAYLYNANLIYSMGCPEGYSDEHCDVFMDIVYSEFYPRADAVQEKAIARYKRVIDTARSLEQHNDWVSRAQEALNELDPFSYPDVKTEITGGTDSAIYPEVEPVSPELTQSPDTPEESAAEPDPWGAGGSTEERP